MFRHAHTYFNIHDSTIVILMIVIYYRIIFKVTIKLHFKQTLLGRYLVMHFEFHASLLYTMYTMELD